MSNTCYQQVSVHWTQAAQCYNYMYNACYQQAVDGHRLAIIVVITCKIPAISRLGLIAQRNGTVVITYLIPAISRPAKQWQVRDGCCSYMYNTCYQQETSGASK